MLSYVKQRKEKIDEADRALNAEESPSHSDSFNDMVRFGKDLRRFDPDFSKMLTKLDDLASQDVLLDFKVNKTMSEHASEFSRASRHYIYALRVCNYFVKKYEAAKEGKPLVYTKKP